VLLSCIASSLAQQIGTNTPEVHPQLPIQTCTKSGCTTVDTSIVLDPNWRWSHNLGGSTNCYTGNKWDASLCPDGKTCAANCAIDGADYSGTYGISTSGNSLDIKFVTHGPYSTNIGSRVYLLEDSDTYMSFKLKNKEFAFDVDVSNMPCGLNGALYFVEMPTDGGLGQGNNKAGAKYGTGYCDAQCPHDIKWQQGEANVQNWKPSPDDPNSGAGYYGSCCFEMDIWEANSVSTAYTPHACSVNGLYRCSGAKCGDSPDNRYGGVCDKDGCDFNSYRLGVKNFYGNGSTLDTTKPLTVVTQFITGDNTDNGDLVEIKRFYVQNGKVIGNSESQQKGLKPYNSISDQFCADQKTLFGDKNAFASNGGLKAMGNALSRGVVLVMSLWDDHVAHMLWLDSSYPVDKTVSTPGVARGNCATTTGVPSDVESLHPDANVKFSNIKFGAINSTFNA